MFEVFEKAKHKTMEDELRCPICKKYFVNPVLLPCYHALCLACAVDFQATIVNATSTVEQLHSHNHNQSIDSHSSSSAASTTSSLTSAVENVSSDPDQVDKVSIFSEADSGVVCNTSRPDSYLATNSHNFQITLFSPTENVLSLPCPVCHKIAFLDDNGARSLPSYRIMESIVDRFHAREALRCQMCESGPKIASYVCEQCEVRYCETCRELCHPVRGPLAKHKMVKPKGTFKIRESKCPDHLELFKMYCSVCKTAACSQCLLNNKHESHDIQSITVMCKAQKTELSHNLQKLSEKARSTTEFIQRLKGMSDKVTESCSEFEKVITLQCEALIQAIHNKRECLLKAVRMDKDNKIRLLKDQQLRCTGKLQQTTSLIEFCIEALKETDSAAFLQIGPMLINRVVNTDVTWYHEVTNAVPRVSSVVNLTLDDSLLINAIENLNLIDIEMKSPLEEGENDMPAAVPSTPTLIHENCSAQNNSVTVAWQQPRRSFVEGYVLELDDGSGGEFQEVYCGKETICTIDGLHFDSMYNARVKAFNCTGEGEYSELICLQTAKVAWFTFDPHLSDCSASGLVFRNNNTTVSAEGWEHKVALGSVGFSKGIHYWEFTVDKYTADTDPAFGIARIDVNRDKMLGKDENAFAMYIDRQRSWFQHNSIHERRVEGGISTGSIIGVLLNLERHTLSFLVNEMPQGSVAFHGLYGVFYPAISINRGVTLTLHTGLQAPQMDYH